MPEDAVLQLAPREPCWFFPPPRGPAVAAAQAQAFVQRLDEQDRRLLIFVHGLGLDLGTVARALQLDPSIVAWRVRHALQQGAGENDPAALERGIVAWLQGRAEGARSTADALIAQFPAALRERLAEQVRGDPAEPAAAAGTAGLGIGSLVLILLAVAGFVVYGTIRDVNPLWRGKALTRQQNYPEARRSLQEAGSLPEARAWIALTWVAEGQFEKALEVLGEPGVAQYFGDFQPVRGSLQPVEAEAASGALLPRGVTLEPRPKFVFRAAPAGTLRLELQMPGRPGGHSITQSIDVPDTRGGNPIVELDYPQDWPVLGNTSVVWTVPGDEVGGATFIVLSRDERIEIQNHARARLTSEIPPAAQTFLRAHYYLKNKLYAGAAERFAGLARQFPDEDYPRHMLAEIGTALAVDPSVFLR